jgi:hypothetical protein
MAVQRTSHPRLRAAARPLTFPGGKEHMHLTPREVKYIARIRKREQSWRWQRWVCLVFSLLIVVCSFGFLFLAFKAVREDLPGSAMLFSIGFTKAHFYLLIGAVALGLTTRYWRGNMDRALLLKLIDQCNSPDIPPTTTVQPTANREDAGGHG